MRLPAVSPDGRWLAYASNESGRYEVYARALDGTGRWPVSIGGGNQPVWSRDGRTLYYRSDTHIMAASVAPGAAFTIVDRKPFVTDHFSVENTVNYDAMPDGKRLAVIVPSAEAVQIHVVVGWMAEVRKRLAATGVK